ncbi:MAG: 50S ribosomal protein L7Ae-like protein [Clostridia bacterium]|nr:50S ribosomal protein L7Ae-like protein [Clostridia bacterium]
MSLTDLKEAASRVFGTKQTSKAVQNGRAKVVYIARDAENHVVDPLMKTCKEKGIEVVMVDSMKELGNACNIDVGAASAALIQE